MGFRYAKAHTGDITDSGPCQALVAERRDRAPACNQGDAMPFTPNYNATAECFDKRAAKSRDPRERARFAEVAAKYRAMAKQTAAKNANKSPQQHYPMRGQ